MFGFTANERHPHGEKPHGHDSTLFSFTAGHEHKHGEKQHERRSSVIRKIAEKMDKYLKPVSTGFAWLGAASLGFMVLMIMWAVIARRIMDNPFRGSHELTELSLIIVVFATLSYEFFKHESMVIDLLVDKMPARCKHILSPVIRFLTVVMLGVLCRQLVVQAMRMQSFNQHTRLLELPIAPFVYFAAFGVALLAIVYIKHFLFALDKAVQK